MTGKPDTAQEPRVFRAVLTQHRSLTPRGFMTLMSVFGLVCFVMGLAFAMIGAWPVLGFCGLDVALVYYAFKLNYRAARAYEIVEIAPSLLRVSRVDARGGIQHLELNPYWVRVVLEEFPDGRAELRLASHGREYAFGHVLNHDERREFASVLRSALAAARG